MFAVDFIKAVLGSELNAAFCASEGGLRGAGFLNASPHGLPVRSIGNWKERRICFIPITGSENKMNIETTNAPKLHCPYCGGRQLQAVTNITRYWCCADCGNTFPFPQDLQERANFFEQNAKDAKKVANLCWILGAVLFTLCTASNNIAILLITGVPIALLWLIAALYTFWLSPSQLKDAEKLRVEYEDLISKCME
ncbi:MAG: hypothetical protein IKN96_07980 [Oscillibacter sp.]|nr:hypothetical protein [Oscillibacter sp.]